jgi:hypothetical protein
MMYRAVNYADIWYGDIVFEDIGLFAAFQDWILPNGFAKISVLYDDSRRIWGDIWGTSVFPAVDNSSGMDTFPYNDYGEVLFRDFKITSDYNRVFSDGVYVKDSDDIFIAGLYRQDQSATFYQDWILRVGKRDPVLESVFLYPETLTDRMKELMLGNADSFTWTYNYYTTLWEYEESRAVEDQSDLVINCGGDEFMVFQQYELGETPGFADYGIFTKKDTGLDLDGKVSASKVEPVYAYSVVKGYIEDGEQDAIIYGMVLDGLHYRTEEFIAQYMTSWEVAISGCENVKDSLGNTIKPCDKVRIGVKKITVKEEIEVDDNG